MIKTMFISCFLPIRKQSFPLQGDREDAANYPGAVQGRVFVVVGSGFVGPVQCPTPGAGCLQELFPGQISEVREAVDYDRQVVSVLQTVPPLLVCEL